jgi:protocatechuate 3,4-dioxygenase beta subunit
VKYDARMALRDSARRSAVAALLLIAGAAASVAVRRAFETTRDGALAGRGAPIDPTGADARSRVLAARGTARPRDRAPAAEEPEDAAAVEASGEGAPERPAPGGAVDPNAKGKSGARVDDVPAANPADFALCAKPDVDPRTGAAPAAAPGKPPELDLATYVARGAAAVERAAELKGERKPALDEGVPVSLTGRVVEQEGGAPVAGARVVVLSTFYVRLYFYDHHLREVARAETDADGAYAIERLDADPAHFGAGGRLYVTVTAEGHAPALAVPLATVSPGLANRLPDVALRRATQTVRGRVIDLWEGKPVVGARVIATGGINPIVYPKDERPALFVGAPATVTDGDGRFVLEGLGGGVQTLSAHAGDDCIGMTVVALPCKDAVLVRARQIRGRIAGTTVDARGDPVALVDIEGGDNSTHSFADGRFELANFRGDAVTIRFTHPDYAPVVLEAVRDGTTGLVVRIERRRSVVVLDVRDRDTDAPVSHVRLEFAFAAESDRPAPTSPEHLSPDGLYAVRVPEGATTLSVGADGHAPEVVSLAGRTDGDTVRVTLAPSRGP